MRLVSFPGGFGRIEGDCVVRMGGDILGYLRAGEACEDESAIALQGLSLVAPVPSPGKIICVGLNYRDHALETGQSIPTEPVLFAKYANSLVGPGCDVVVPAAASSAIDYEAELGVVIGRAASRVRPGEALDYVAGYMCLNDVSDRDLQMRGGQWMRGKAIDTFMPAGPWLTTVDELPSPQNLGIRCIVNGEVRQESNTRQMIFGVSELVSFIRRTISLVPGDVIATGTPAGVGMAMIPPRYLRFGDEVVVEIGGLGALRSRVSAETR